MIMKNVIALYALVCVCMLSVYAMEEGMVPVVQRNYFDMLSDEVIFNILHRLVDSFHKTYMQSLRIKRKALGSNRRSFLLTCKRFNEIGESEFINYMFKQNYYESCNSKMHIAASLNAVRWIKNALKDPKNAYLINSRNKVMQSPLHHAAKHGSLDAARLLIKKGAHVDSQDLCKNNMTPLHYAVLHDRLEMAQVLIDLGANVNASGVGYTPICCAIGWRRTSIVKLLFDKGATLDSAESGGYVRRCSDPEIIELIEQALAKKVGMQ